MDVSQISGARADIDELMSKIKQVSNNSKLFEAGNAKPESANSFENIMALAKNGMSEVSQLQMTSETMKDAYLSGQGNVSMAQMIVSSQKSKIAFEGLMAVRNKILEAYKEIMSMQV